MPVRDRAICTQLTFDFVDYVPICCYIAVHLHLKFDKVQTTIS